MAWEAQALWAARGLWGAGTAACLLASDLPVGVEALRRVAHYGKLRGEVAALPATGPARRLQARLAQLSLPPRAVWTAYYVGGAALNLACLAFEPCVVLALLQLHLARRIYESLCVTRFSEQRREHPLTVCVGAFFYMLLSPSLALEVRAARSASARPHSHRHHHHARRAPGHAAGRTRFVAGVWLCGAFATCVCRITCACHLLAHGQTSGWDTRRMPLGSMVWIAVFVAANVAQHLAHVELARLREAPDAQRLLLHSPSRAAKAHQAYGVPRGWLFRNMSCCPHYSCEVLLYSALAALASTEAARAQSSGGRRMAHARGTGLHVLSALESAVFSFVDLPAVLSFLPAVFSFVNLSITAVRTRRWYAKQSDTAHLSKSAILPGLL